MKKFYNLGAFLQWIEVVFNFFEESPKERRIQGFGGGVVGYGSVEPLFNKNAIFMGNFG